MNLSEICQKSIEVIKNVGQFILVENQDFDLSKNIKDLMIWFLM